MDGMEASSWVTERPFEAAWAMIDAWFEQPSEARERMAELLPQLSSGERADIEGAIRQLQRWEVLLELTERHLEKRSLVELRANVGRCLQKSGRREVA